MGKRSNWQRSLRRNLTEVEKRTDLTDDQKVALVTRLCSAACAGVAVQPIPFADFFVLTPMQMYAGTRIAAIRGVRIGERGAQTVVKEILGAVGLGLLGQQLVIGAYKTFIPVLGAVTTVPLVYGATTAICAVMDAYFKAAARGATLGQDEMRRLWESEKARGEQEGREREQDIREEAAREPSDAA
jgi:uncharacterized protein (DUF697 family)